MMRPDRYISKYLAETAFTYRASKWKDQVDANIPALKQVALYPNSKIAFNRIKKNGNTSLVLLLDYIEYGHSRHTRIAKRQTSLNSIGSCLVDYSQFSWAITIRNPFTRVLSAFLDKFSKERYISTYGKFELSSKGFSEFVVWLSNGGLKADNHWNLQVEHTLFPIENYGYILRFENLSDDIVKMIGSLNLSIPTEAFSQVMRKGQSNSTGSSKLIHQFYDARTFEIVSKLYEKDFRKLGYSPVKSDVV